MDNAKTRVNDGQCSWESEDRAPTLPTASNTPAVTPSASPSILPKEKLLSSASSTGGRAIRVSYLTEQTSHHPPVSAFWIDCPEKGIFARGYDQISAKFTGTSIRVIPGSHNLGIFIELRKWGGEQYQLTHPAAYLGGFLRGN